VAPDLVFTNAALHWVPDHETLLPHLLGLVAPGGTLAWQVPDGWDDPSHTIAWELAAEAPWAGRLTPSVARHPLLTPAAYLDLLLPIAAEVDLWTTTYHHVLDGPDPVVAWYLGSFLRAFISGLPADEADAFVAEYARRVASAYPVRADGRTVLPFRRVFGIARAHP
jgi:trans-aconitate 2-methyltransferase